MSPGPVTLHLVVDTFKLKGRRPAVDVVRQTSAALHGQAMRLWEAGNAAPGICRRMAFRRAFRLEARAAQLEGERPSSGILWRSAAWIALDADNPTGAAWAALHGLGMPFDLPNRVRCELVQVLRLAMRRVEREGLVRP